MLQCALGKLAQRGIGLDWVSGGRRHSDDNAFAPGSRTNMKADNTCSESVSPLMENMHRFQVRELGTVWEFFFSERLETCQQFLYRR